MKPRPLVIVSVPRSGSSWTASVVASEGILPFASNSVISRNSYELQPTGYFEDVRINLLNDQLIRFLDGGSLIEPRPQLLAKLKEHDSARNICHEMRLSHFDYDIDEQTLEIPKDFEEQLHAYTGKDWDPWGLTRMKKNQKWYRCYQKASLRTGAQVAEALDQIQREFASSRGSFLKDPRFCLTLPFLNWEVKVLVVERDFKEVLLSCRSHYGPRLMTAECYPNFTWVSNFFNYKALPQTPEEFEDTYRRLIGRIEETYEFFKMKATTLRSGTPPALKKFLQA